MGILNYKAPVTTRCLAPTCDTSSLHLPSPRRLLLSLLCEMTRTFPRGNYRRMEDWPKPNPNIEEVKLSPDDPLFNFGTSEKKSIVNAYVSLSSATTHHLPENI